MFNINNLPEYLYMGNLGEKLVTEIPIDVSEWLVEYPDGVFGLTYERANEPGIYWPGMDLDVDYGMAVLTWTIGQHALAVEGVGSVVIRLMSGDQEKRSKKTLTRVMPGHGLTGPIPPPIEDYIAQLLSAAGGVIHLVDRAEQAAEDAEEALGALTTGLNPSASVEFLPSDEDPIADVERTIDGLHFDFGIPKPALVYATFHVDVDTGELIMTIPDDYTGPMFRINEETGYLEVAINE